jgi:hypothetical protein
VEEVNPDALEQIITKSKTIGYYLDPLTLICTEQSIKTVVKAYFVGLKDKGKNDNEAKELLSENVKYLDEI